MLIELPSVRGDDEDSLWSQVSVGLNERAQAPWGASPHSFNTRSRFSVRLNQRRLRAFKERRFKRNALCQLLCVFHRLEQASDNVLDGLASRFCTIVDENAVSEHRRRQRFDVVPRDVRTS